MAILENVQEMLQRRDAEIATLKLQLGEANNWAANQVRELTRMGFLDPGWGLTLELYLRCGPQKCGSPQCSCSLPIGYDMTTGKPYVQKPKCRHGGVFRGEKCSKCGEDVR